MKQKIPMRLYQANGTDTIQVGAAGGDKAFVQFICNLHSICDALSSSQDGYKAKVYRVRLTAIGESESLHTLKAIVVQADGAVTDTVDIDHTTEDVILDNCIAGVFGSQPLGNTCAAKRVPSQNATSATGNEFEARMTIELPTNVLTILNKEIETERLQELSFAVQGRAYSNSQLIYLKYIIEIHYTLVRKGLILR